MKKSVWLVPTIAALALLNLSASSTLAAPARVEDVEITLTPLELTLPTKSIDSPTGGNLNWLELGYAAAYGAYYDSCQSGEVSGKFLLTIGTFGGEVVREKLSCTDVVALSRRFGLKNIQRKTLLPSQGFQGKFWVNVLNINTPAKATEFRQFLRVKN